LDTGPVLVVEDNKTNQLIARSLLQRIGVEVLTASDGQQAVDLFRENRERIPLILMDLHMPVMNGYEAAREIRKISEEVPIIAMTADVILGVREKCLECGIGHYISKPFDPDKFLSLVREILMEGLRRAQEPKVLNEDAGLSNMGGNESIYRQVLEEYHRENQGTLEGLAAAVTEKRFADAARIVHKVKSSSGSIGANVLHQMSVEFQRVLESEKEMEIEILHKRFVRLLESLMQEIVQYLNGVAGTGQDPQEDDRWT